MEGGCEIVEWLQHEAALGKARMRQGQLPGASRQTIHNEQVQIQCTRGPPTAALPPGAPFQVETYGEQRLRTEARPHLHDGIQIGGLLLVRRQGVRDRLVHRRGLHYPEAWRRIEPPQGAPQSGHPVAQIGAESDEGYVLCRRHSTSLGASEGVSW